MATKAQVVQMICDDLNENGEFKGLKRDDDDKFEWKPKHVKEFLTAVEEVVLNNLKAEKKIPITNLVTIKLNDRKKRMGRNPATGESIKIPAKRVVKVLPPKWMKDTFNKVKKKGKK